MNLGRWAEEWGSGSTPPTRVHPNFVGGGGGGKHALKPTKCPQTNQTVQRCPLVVTLRKRPCLRPSPGRQQVTRLRKHEEEEEEAQTDSGSLRADTPEAAGGLQQKQRLRREAPQDTERLPSTHLGLRN